MFTSNIHIPLRLVIMIQSYPRVHKSWIPGITHATKFCRVVPNTSGYSVWNLLHIILLVSRISRWLPNFWKICATLAIPMANLVHLNHIYILWICPCNIINTVHTSSQHSILVLCGLSFQLPSQNTSIS